MAIFKRISVGAAALALAGIASPAFAQEAIPPPLPLGNVLRLAGVQSCRSPGCIQFEITTPETVAQTTAMIKVTQPGSLPSRGTIIFLTGGKGSKNWENFGPDAKRVLADLSASGFRTVQISWPAGWLIGATGQLEGQQRLASRAATLVRWVYDNIHDQAPQSAFCATGNSAGASEIAYMLVDYGLSGILSAVVLTSGPPFSRIDLGCIHAGTASQPFWYPSTGRVLIDRGFGFTSAGTGPCSRGDETFRSDFVEASLTPKHGRYDYPTTMTWFLFGAQDKSGSVAQGMRYHDEIARTGNLLLGAEVLPGTPHDIPSTPQGANRIRDLMLLECRPR